MLEPQQQDVQNVKWHHNHFHSSFFVRTSLVDLSGEEWKANALWQLKSPASSKFLLSEPRMPCLRRLASKGKITEVLWGKSTSLESLWLLAYLCELRKKDWKTNSTYKRVLRSAPLHLTNCCVLFLCNSRSRRKKSRFLWLKFESRWSNGPFFH